MIGIESSKTFQKKYMNGFFEAYMKGTGLDIGPKGSLDSVEPILNSAIAIDLDYPGYNGRTLPFATESQDYVYSSHCLEHIEDWENTLKEWYRVTKVGGFMIIVVPHMYLYEKKEDIPSQWNEDHKRYYTPGSLLIELENSLVPNSYRVKLLEDGDDGFDYSIPNNKHSCGQYEITLVVQKIKKPDWELKT